MQEYEMPEVTPGTSVIVYSTPERSNPIHGTVVKVKARTCDIHIVTENGMGILRSCYHVADPKIQEPEMANRIRGDKDTGVWDLSNDAKITRNILRQLANLQERLTRLEIKASEPDDEPVAPMKRRYGTATRSN